MTATYASTTNLKNFMGLNSSDTTYSDTQLQDALDRAEIEINREINTVFVDGTADTPAWTQITNEKHTGKGVSDRRYFLEKYPIPDVSTTVVGTAVGTSTTTIYAVNTQGFPSSGFISIESDKIQYTGKTGSAFTGVTSVSAAHGTAETIRPYTIEISTTAEGQATSWTVMEYDKEYDIDLSNGRIYLNDASLESNASNTVAFSRYPSYQTPNRFRATYIAGVDSIPADVTKLCCAVAAKDLMSAAVRKAHSLGKNDFNPELIGVDDAFINQTIKRYRKYKFQLV